VEVVHCRCRTEALPALAGQAIAEKKKALIGDNQGRENQTMGDQHTKTNKNRSQVKMPFGKFRGIAVCDLPLSYLAWLSENVDLRQPLKAAIFAEIEDRETRDRSSFEPGISLHIEADDLPIAREIINRGRRAAAALYHPDKEGGSTRVMQTFNRVALSLSKQLEGLEAAR
jgi:hypothetical protein